MSHDHERRHATTSPTPVVDHAIGTPGKISLSSMLRRPENPIASGLVQRKATGPDAAGASTDAVHAAAARGTNSPTTALPFADRIQASFGDHDISHIKAHVGGDTAAAMGANAYATGDHVVFDRAPDLHTAAHEAAHVIQQARGVNLYGGVGAAGDAYERHADAVADRVVAGQSAADLLGAPTASASRGGAVQRDTESEKPHDDADAASARAMGATIERVANRMASFKAFIAAKQKLKSSDPNDTAGWARITPTITAEAIAINSDIDFLERYVSSFAPTGSMQAKHTRFKAQMWQFKSAWEGYKKELPIARDWVLAHQGAFDARDANVDALEQTVGNAFRSFDVKLADSPSTPIALGKETPLEHARSTAATSLDLELEAARLSAHALRMELKEGRGPNVEVDVSHTVMHVHETARAIAQLDKKDVALKRDALGALLEEIVAVRAATKGGRHEARFNTTGPFDVSLGTIQSAYHAAGKH